MPSLDSSLRDYFRGRPDVEMAFVFGSRGRAQEHANSDLDIAVYFTPLGRQVEWEVDRAYPAERDVWNAVETIAEIDTDFIVLNRCPATLADTILREGRALAMRDIDLHTRFLLIVTDEAERFRRFAFEVWKMQEASADSQIEHRHRLVRTVRFIRVELSDGPAFADLSQHVYETDSMMRRSVERWIENLANASIDGAKVILALHDMRIPQTYRLTLAALSGFDGLDADIAGRLGEYAQLRNILAHEYLDVKFEHVRGFLDTAIPDYERFADFLNLEIVRSAEK